MGMANAVMVSTVVHQFLVRNRPFAGIRRVLAGLFTFSSRWPIGNWSQLMEGTSLKLSSIMICKMSSVTHANEQQETSNASGN